MLTLDQLIENINRDQYYTVDSIINKIVRSKTIQRGLFVADLVNDNVRTISVYEKDSSNYTEYDILAVKRQDNKLTVVKATPEQAKKFIEIVTNKDNQNQ